MVFDQHGASSNGPRADVAFGHHDRDHDLGENPAIYANRCVMITGAGGSIGAELTRQLLRCGPSKLLLFEMSERALYHITQDIQDLDLAGTTDVIAVLGSVTDEGLVRRVIAQHGVDVVVHAAAYKHVTIVENNVLVGLQNNVLGTRVLAQAARDGGVGRFILVSSDKAVQPASVMGASKRLAEYVIQDFAARAQTTRFSIVRFGNVFGSSGSVVPRFAAQIARGGPVTLTHPDATRYFMTLREAAGLVLMAGVHGRSGDIFVLDMGAPVRILDLAHHMIAAAGRTLRDAQNPQGEIEVTSYGLMPGEKLHEDLVSPNSTLIATPHPKILRADDPCLSEIEVARAIQALERALETGDTDAAHAMLARWVRPDQLPGRAQRTC